MQSCQCCERREYSVETLSSIAVDHGPGPWPKGAIWAGENECELKSMPLEKDSRLLDSEN